MMADSTAEHQQSPLTRPMRVLLMAGSMETGGSERQTLLLLRHLDRSRFEPHLFLCRDVGDLLDLVPNDVPVYSFERDVPPPSWYWPGRMHRMQQSFVRELVHQHQLDLVYDRTFHMTLIAGAAIGPSSSVARVATIVSPPDRDVMGTERRFVWWKRQLLRRAYQSADVVIAVSDAVAQSTRDFYRLKDDPKTGHDPLPQLVVRHNPVDVEAVRQAATDAKNGRGIPFGNRWYPPETRGLKIVCVGRMTQEKGHRYLLQAMTTLVHGPNRTEHLPHLLLVGDGPLRSELQGLVKTCSLQKHVTFAGQVPDACAAIAASDVLCLPSLYEGMPNAVLEAMALRVPVIGTRAGGTITLLDQGRCGWEVPPGDAPAMADVLRQFPQQTHEVNRRVESAALRVDAQFSVGPSVQRLQESMFLAYKRRRSRISS